MKTQIPNLDMSDPTNAAIADLIDKGLIEYGYNEDGELMLSLTEDGMKIAEQVAKE